MIEKMSTDIESECEKTVTAGDKGGIEVGYPKVEILDLEGSFERKSVKTLDEQIFDGSDCIENDGMRRKLTKIRDTRVDENFRDFEAKSEMAKLAKEEDDASYDELGF